MKSFKDKIEMFQSFDERIDNGAHNYDVNMSQLQSLFKKWGTFGIQFDKTEYAIGKDNGREIMDDAKIIIDLVKKLRRG